MVCLLSCVKETYPSQPDWSQYPDPSVTEKEDGLKKPLEPVANVVAHRGGSAEGKCPDNSLASLRYAISLGCYASECDIYWTKDDNVIVAHADGQCMINGLHPWEATVAEIRAAGTLSNGEQIPTLGEFIDEVMKDGSSTKLWLDIKNITSPSTLTQYPISAVKRSCEIIAEKGAKHFVEFICTSNSTVMTQAFAYASLAEVNIGWMANQSAATYQSKTYKWANLAASSMTKMWGGSGARTLEEFENAGIPLSIFNIDMQAGDGNAVYDGNAVKQYVNNASRFKALCTNYPSWLINQLVEAAKTYDGISSLEELRIFAEEVQKDPSAARFQNASGEVVLKTNLTISGEWEPINGFDGVFNGNGKTITLNVKSAANKLAVFGTVKGTVKNLTVEGKVESTAKTGETQIAAIAVETDGAIFENCTSKADVIINTTGDEKRWAIMGNIAAKVSNGSTFKNCRNEGKISLTADNAYYSVGAIFSVSANDDGKIVLENCSNTGDFTIDAGNTDTWSYLGGLAGKPQGVGQLLLADGWHMTVKGCSNSGNIKFVRTPKFRAGGISGYAKTSTSIEGSKFSGKVDVASPGAYDCVFGGILGFQETTCDALVKNCEFDGIIAANGTPGNLYFGGITTTGGSDATVVDGCKTSKDAVVDITGTAGKSVAMIAGRPNKAITVKNCLIAGKLVDKSGKATVINPVNLADWMFKGSATTAAVILENNGFNGEGAGPYVGVSPEEIMLTATETSTSFGIQSNANWTVSTTADWVSSYTKSGTGNGTVAVVVTANPTMDERRAEFTVSATGAESVKVTLVQAGKADDTPHCVSDPAEFSAFISALNAGSDISRWQNASGIVTLSADIDASEAGFPIASIPADLVIDGQNHKIFNVSVSGTGATGLITNNAGTVKNLIIGSADGTSYDGKSVISAAATPTHMGVIAQSSGRVENVKNFAKISYSGSPTLASSGLGGIVGLVTGGLVDSCENYGEIVLDKSVTIANEIRVGGIVGRADSGNKEIEVTISNCTNRAPLTVTTKIAKVVMMGGIIGVAQNGAALSGCKNEAAVSYNQSVAPSTWMAVGGIAGALYTTSTARNCTNNAKVSSDLTQVVRIAGISAVVNSGGTVDGCVNNGEVALKQATNANWQAVGGIVGFEEKGTAADPIIIRNNTNAGAVTVEVNNATTHANKVALGGVIGTACSVIQLSSNINKGTVTGTNAGTGGIYAGGITGWYIKGSSFTGTKNENSGNVSVTASAGFAGGIIGSANVSGVNISNDKTKADVKANTAGALAAENNGTLTDCSAGGTVNGAAVSLSNMVASGSGTHTGDVIL